MAGGEWPGYSLEDFLLFSSATYYRLFELHNRAVWPGQLLAGVLGLAILGLLHRAGAAWRGRAVAAILAACWLWVAWAYLLGRYDTINWAARYFAAAFAFQAVLLAWSGLARDRLRPATGPAARAGVALLLFALLLQPLVGPLLAGRAWAGVELFAVAPDPTVLATLGVLLAADRLPWELLPVPLLWCAVSGATAWAMDSPDAPLMPAAAVLTLALAARRVLAWSR